MASKPFVVVFAVCVLVIVGLEMVAEVEAARNTKRPELDLTKCEWDNCHFDLSHFYCRPQKGMLQETIRYNFYFPQQEP